MVSPRDPERTRIRPAAPGSGYGMIATERRRKSGNPPRWRCAVPRGDRLQRRRPPLPATTAAGTRPAGNGRPPAARFRQPTSGSSVAVTQHGTGSSRRSPGSAVFPGEKPVFLPGKESALRNRNRIFPEIHREPEYKKTRPPFRKGAFRRREADYITMIEKTSAKIAQVSTTPRIIR